MTRRVDLLIVGAGPAGLSAAATARRRGLEVLVVDEQPAPGGQIWRGIETVANTKRAAILGKAYTEGLSIVRAFRASGAQYEPGTQVWQVEPGPRAFMTREGSAFSVDANAMLLATGAQERPVPFAGWTLPGVMTVGAGQILLKSSDQISESPVWIAGSGPLVLLYAVQLLNAGGQIAGILDTTPKGRIAGALSKLAMAAIGAPKDLLKGVAWIAALKTKTRIINHVIEVEAQGGEALERIRFTTANGKTQTVNADVLMVHEGLVPTIHPTLALGCRHVWNPDQDSYMPKLDGWGETSEPGIFVAGDGAGIGGAIAACRRGEIAALRIAARAGRLSAEAAEREARPVRAALKRALASRPFLDALYRPRPMFFAPADATLVCRCEEVSAGRVRKLAAEGHRDPNQIKMFTRAGMGPCQARQCNYAIASILASHSERIVPHTGIFRVRPPFKPLTLGELAALDTGATV